MQLKNLSIRRSWDGKELVGEIEIAGESSETKLKLTEAQCDKLIAVVANELVTSAKELAQTLVANTLELKVVKQIERNDGEL